ncbi:superoxide dismutase [Cu-Zn]-like [Tribolium madens]|uniref:superoxide dismutase [Cu-Zn]-like n=1 Tax=Tribolium madens TaxID=41895 RepID=UPI001CF72CD9|nr:superoxide dismutase [Cu-Zn]-like [Tribolium madens]
MFKSVLLCFTFVTIKTVQSAAMQTLAIRNALYQVPGLGNRPLIIKMYPGVENYQSDIYEVYAEPYTFDLRSASAVALLQGEGESKGEVVFFQRHPPNGPILVRGNLTALPPGKHGLHIHQSGDLRQGCEKLGPHFNPYQLQHGGPSDPVRHVGDLGNIEVGEDGSVEFSIADPLLALMGGPRGIVGRSIVVSGNPDDLGRGGTAESLVNGDSGKTIACGVIAYIK